jgi:hypothetical protein
MFRLRIGQSEIPGGVANGQRGGAFGTFSQALARSSSRSWTRPYERDARGPSVRVDMIGQRKSALFSSWLPEDHPPSWWVSPGLGRYPLQIRAILRPPVPPPELRPSEALFLFSGYVLPRPVVWDSGFAGAESGLAGRLLCRPGRAGFRAPGPRDSGNLSCACSGAERMARGVGGDYETHYRWWQAGEVKKGSWRLGTVPACELEKSEWSLLLGNPRKGMPPRGILAQSPP